MDRYIELKSFVLTAELGSFTKAAQVEGVTSIIMARRLSSLEKRLGVTLIHRSTRGLTLTHAGKEHLQLCKNAVKKIDEVEEAIRSSHNEVCGKLNITAPAGFGRKHVAPHVHSFIREYPNIELSLHLTDKVTDLVRDGFDLAIRIGKELNPNYVTIKLHENCRVVCGTKEYFSKHPAPEKPRDLIHHNCLTFPATEGSQASGWEFNEDGNITRVRVDGNIECNEGEIIYNWALDGLGLVWRSVWEVAADIQSGKLITVLDEYSMKDYDILAVYQLQPHLPLKTRCFIQHLKSIYNEAGYWPSLLTSDTS